MESIGSFKIDEGVDAFGTRTEIIFDGEQVVNKRSFDAAPLLKEAAEARAVTASDRWSEGLGTRVGTVPMAIYQDALRLSNVEERNKYLLNWIRQNPHFCTFDKFLKK
jgi:hypothetical protein